MTALYNNRIFQHSVFWIAQVVSYTIVYGSYADNYGQIFYQELVYLPVKIIFTYFVMYYLLPFLLTGKYVLFFTWFVGGSLLAGIAQRYVAFTLDYPIYYPEGLNDPFFWFPKVSKMIVGIYPYTFFAIAIK